MYNFFSSAPQTNTERLTNKQQTMVQPKKPPAPSSRKKETAILPLGVKLIIGFFLVSIPLWIVGQGGAVVAYDTVAAWGLQAATRQDLDPVIVEECRGIGLADVLVQVPLFVVAIIGLRRLEFYGAVASWLTLGINVYWPVVAWSKQSFFVQAENIQCEPWDAAVHVPLVFIVLFSGWACVYLYQNRKLVFD